MKNIPSAEIVVQKALIKKAQEFANSGDSMAMMQCLVESLLLDALLRHFSFRYPHQDPEDIYDTIASAVDEICADVASRKTIKRLESYLWKIVNNKLYKASVSLLTVTSISKNEYEIKDEGIVPEEYQTKRDEIRKEARKKAIEIAEGLLPRLGTVNVQAVMKYILEALKNGSRDVPHSEIAEALHLSQDNVKVWVSRGFEKLSKIVKEDKIVDDSIEFPFLEEIDTYMSSNYNDESSND